MSEKIDAQVGITEVNSTDIFQKVVINNRKQNQRLSAKLSNGSQKTSPNGLNNGQPIKNDHLIQVRFLVCTLGLLSLALSQMSRMVFNLSITSMVDPCMISKRTEISSDGSCPWPDEITGTTSGTDEFDTSLSSLTTVDYTIHGITDDTLQPEDYNQTSPGAVDCVSDKIPAVDRFKWNMQQQNVLLGGFYYSYFVFMILGGRMSEIYGAKYVLLLCVAGSAIINLATPWMARNSFALLVVSRIIMGAIQSGVFPGMYALIAKWLTMSEASIYAPMVKMCLRLGMLLGSLTIGFLPPEWPIVFYFTGAVSAVWSLLWLLIATSNPADNKWVSKVELAHIMKKKRQPPAIANEDVELGQIGGGTNSKPARAKKTPWLKILTSPSVIGLVLVKLASNYALDFLAIELPSYLNYVHHASTQTVSSITTRMFAIQVALVVFAGWLAKIMVKRRPLGLTKTAIRKIFQALPSYGVGVGFFLITLNDCNLIYVSLMLQIISFLTVFTAGGETMLPYDLSDEYPATIMAIANSVANISGVTTTVLAGQVLGNQGGSFERWNLLINLIAGVNIVGGLAFSILVKAEPIDFTANQKGDNSQLNLGGTSASGCKQPICAEVEPEKQETTPKVEESGLVKDESEGGCASQEAVEGSDAPSVTNECKVSKL